MRKRLFICMLLCFFQAGIFGGCKKDTQKLQTRVVTQVDIRCQRQDVQIHRHYTDEKKMGYVLTYLRLLEPTGAPIRDPHTIRPDVYQITVVTSDGQQTVYRQKGHRYLAINDRPWHAIDPAMAAGLYKLMARLPSDSAAAFFYL